MSNVHINTIDNDLKHISIDTIKEFLSEKGIEYVINKVGNLVLDVSSRELNTIYNGFNTIGEVASCNFDQEWYLMENHAFTSQNINVVHTYCATKSLINTIPIHGFKGSLVKSYFNESIKPEYNLKSINSTILERIHTKLEYGGFAASSLIKMPYYCFHWFFEKPVQETFNFISNPKESLFGHFDDPLKDFNTNHMLSFTHNGETMVDFTSYDENQSIESIIINGGSYIQPVDFSINEGNDYIEPINHQYFDYEPIQSEIIKMKVEPVEDQLSQDIQIEGQVISLE